jgi:AcrR family transcriptional regulator
VNDRSLFPPDQVGNFPLTGSLSGSVDDLYNQCGIIIGIMDMSSTDYRDRLKSDIVRISREILATDGLGGLQARKVSQAANCSVGTIYNLFGNLDMVVISANAGTLSELEEVLQRSRVRDRDQAGQLTALALAYLDFAMQRTSEWRAVFEHRFATKTMVPDWYREAQSQLFAIVEGIIEPTVPDEARRREVSRAMFSAVHGVVSLALDAKLGAFDEQATKRQVTFITRSAARGLIENDGSQF